MTNNPTIEFSPLALIKAGAGAGKTYQIQQTLVEWIQQGHVQPNRILAVTFTEAAAQEMKERIKQALIEKCLFSAAEQVDQSQISTIHSFGLSIIKRFSYEQGLSAKPRQLSDSEQKVLISLALNDVTVIDPILDSLEVRGYESGWSANEEGDVRVAKLQRHIKSVFDLLQKLPQQKDEALIQSLIDQAANALSEVYQAQSTKEEVLNKGLMDAISAITNKYQKSELIALWGTAQSVLPFIHALYRATPELISTDWKFWLKLKRLSSASKIIKKIDGEPSPIEKNDGQLAFDVWSAIDKLVYHKGPLRTATETVEVLLKGANQALVNYQMLKTKSSLIDYSDMVSLSNTLLLDKRWLDEISNNYDCLIIDEFQDTNPQQFDLLWKLSKAGLNTLVVGDLKQSIMGFQGSDSHLFASLLEHYPDSVRELTNNWRSSAKVMEFVNQLGHALFPTQYHSLTPCSQLDSKLPPVHKLVFDPSEWNRKKTKNADPLNSSKAPLVVAEHIKSLLDRKVEVIDRHTKNPRVIRPSDIAVLARNQSYLDKFSDALSAYGLQYRRDKQNKTGDENWSAQREVRYLLSGLNYLANPNDREAKLSLKLYSKESDLEKALQDVIDNHDDSCSFDSNALKTLKTLQRGSCNASTCLLVTQCAQALGLLSAFSPGFQKDKQCNANVLKMIGLAEEFEKTHAETLQSQGVFGRSLSSFLLWLTINQEDISALPNIDNDNKNAVNLVTWHKSKGLEWPIVVVAQLEKEEVAKYPDSKLKYSKQTSLAGEMLDDAWINITPKFAHPETTKKFDEAQAVDLDKDLKNLCYVALTRAREQIILPWCDLPSKTNNMLGLIRGLDYSNALVTEAKMPTELEPAVLNQPRNEAKAVKAWTKEIEPELVDAEINPSTIVINQSQLETNNQKHFAHKYNIDLNAAVDLDPIRENHSSAEVGTWLHQCYQVLLSKPAYAGRLWQRLPQLAEQEILCSEIVAQISSFNEIARTQLGARDIQSEVPFLAKHESGAVVSGVVDCLIETDDGIIIIDHKTDQVMSAEAFEHHCHQLKTYAEYLGYTKPVIAIGINWIREGEIWLLSCREIKHTPYSVQIPTYTLEELVNLLGIEQDMFELRLEECLPEYKTGNQLLFVENPQSPYKPSDLEFGTNFFMKELGERLNGDWSCSEGVYGRCTDGDCRFIRGSSRDDLYCGRTEADVKDYHDDELIFEIICDFSIDEDNEGVFRFLLDGIDPYSEQKVL